MAGQTWATADDGAMSLGLIVPPALREVPPAELAGWAAGAGFAAIDADAEDGDEVAAALRDHGLRPGPMRVRASLADSDPGTRAAAVETALRAIERAVDLGVGTVWTLARNFRNDASQRENFAAAVPSLAEVARHAERRGIRVAIENCPFHGQNPICTPEAWDALFARLPSAALGVCLDPSHCVWQGIDYLRAAREYGPRVFHVHAKDAEVLPEGRYRYGVEGPQIEDLGEAGGWPREGWWRYRLPGLGAVDWNAFVSALADAGYGGAISVEHEDPLWGGSAERVRRGLERARAYLGRFVP